MHGNMCWHRLCEVAIIDIIIVVILVIFLVIYLLGYLLSTHLKRVRNGRLPHQVATSTVVERDLDL